MGNETELFNQSFIKTLESSIEKLPKNVRGELFRPCAVGCVKNYVLAEQQRQFNECGCDLDRQYEKYGRSDFFFADIIESGHVYEIGYPRCLCPMVDAGYADSPIHCECSLESIRYALETLMPYKEIHVECLHTVLSGARECRFRVTVE